MKILVTGASGFVGKALIEALAGHEMVGTTTTEAGAEKLRAKGVEPVVIPDMGPDTDWSEALQGVDAVIHLAARVHKLQDDSPDPLAEFRRVNAAGTLALARAAGSRRFVFLSTIGLHGEADLPPDPPVVRRVGDPPDPRNHYSTSKMEAEMGLAEIEGLNYCVVRAPLVYGPDAPGNWGKMMAYIRKGIPLPLGKVSSLRSIISVWNLADFLRFAVEGSFSGTYLVSDGEDISTGELFRRLGAKRLVPVPHGIAKIGLKAIGQENAYIQLWGAFLIDSSPARELGWNPPLTLDEGIRRTVREHGR